VAELTSFVDGINGAYLPTARARERCGVESRRIGGLTVHQLHIGGAGTFVGDGVAGTFVLGVPLTNPVRMRINGRELRENSFVVIREGEPFTFASDGAAKWLCLTVPLNHGNLSSDLAEAMLLATLTTSDLQLQTDYEALRQLRATLARHCNDAAENEQDLAQFEDEIAFRARNVFESSLRLNESRVGRPCFPRRQIISQVLSFMSANRLEALYTVDLQRTTIVSERTLRNVFREHFGVGPIRLLKVCQLQEIRNELRCEGGLTGSVAQIAARHGVTDFSLFSRNYRALYGESPSHTREAHAAHADLSMDAAWLHRAAMTIADRRRSALVALETGNRIAG
jgi:AraC family transcriptional regulator, ethanolamine operon transcriptional activator